MRIIIDETNNHKGHNSYYAIQNTAKQEVVKILDHYRSTGLIGKATHKPPINPISYYQNIILTIP